MSQAYADGSGPPLPDGAYENAFIDLMANESGLSRQDFIATTVNAVTVATGVQFAANPAIKLADATLGNNLDYLIDAADYPAWDTLDYTQQASYGSKANYDSAKYMSLMSAFGMDEDLQRYKDFESSGGGHFLFSDESADRLGRIGKIGERWLNNIAVGFGDLQSLITNQLAINEYLGRTEQSESYYFDAEGISDWPSSVNRKVKLNYGTNFEYISTYDSNTKMYGSLQGSEPIYVALFMEADARNTSITYNNWYGYVYAFNDSDFRFGMGSQRNNYPSVSVTAEPAIKTYNDIQYYEYNTSGSILRRYQDKPFESNFQYNIVEYGSTPSKSDLNKAISIIATNSENVTVEGGGYTPDIEGYPENEEIPQNTPVYFPEQGLSPSNTWNSFITLQRPSNPYNPDDQTATSEWQQETKQNIQGLQSVHFEKLFPFCLYYDLDKFWKKVQMICGISTDENGQLNTQDNNNYNEINLRMYVPNVMDEVWTFDLEPLRDLLLIIKPFMLVFLICLEIVSMIMLWKGILTGS